MQAEDSRVRSQKERMGNEREQRTKNKDEKSTQKQSVTKAVCLPRPQARGRRSTFSFLCLFLLLASRTAGWAAWGATLGKQARQLAGRVGSTTPHPGGGCDEKSRLASVLKKKGCTESCQRKAKERRETSRCGTGGDLQTETA